jgi:multidrug efflux pump subunit AcrA (membrane-fusion protein)
MSVSVDITTDSKDDTLYLPSQSVKHDTKGYYVETDDLTAKPVFTASSTWSNASSTHKFASSTRRMSRGSSTKASVSPSNVTAQTTLKRLPVQIGIETGKEVEILGWLTEGQKVILKKVTSGTQSSSNSAPSITSLFRPGGQQTRTSSGAQGAVRP